MDVCRPLVSDSHVIQTQGPGLASSVFDMTLATWYGQTPLAHLMATCVTHETLEPGKVPTVDTGYTSGGSAVAKAEPNVRQKHTRLATGATLGREHGSFVP